MRVLNSFIKLCLFGIELSFLCLKLSLKLSYLSFSIFQLLLQSFITSSFFKFRLELCNLCLSSSKLSLNCFHRLCFSFVLTEYALSIVVTFFTIFLFNACNAKNISVILTMQCADFSTYNGILIIS